MSQVHEVVYQRPSDVLQIWLIDGEAPPSFNHHLGNGLYEIKAVDDDKLLGYEILDLREFAKVHADASRLVAALDAFGSESVVLRDVDRRHVESILQYA
jgi:hypothetical protein